MNVTKAYWCCRTEPIGAKEAQHLGLVDEILCKSRDGFVDAVISAAVELPMDNKIRHAVKKKKMIKKKKFQKLLRSHREAELREMKRCFESNAYRISRQKFVFKYRKYDCHRRVSIPGSNDHPHVAPISRDGEKTNTTPEMSTVYDVEGVLATAEVAMRQGVCREMACQSELASVATRLSF